MKIIKHFLVFVLIYFSQFSNAQDVDKIRALCTELETKFSVNIYRIFSGNILEIRLSTG